VEAFPVREVLAAGGGFLIAVIWFDLMFDVQALRAPRDGPLPEAALASIMAYYRRVTVDASPMPYLVATVMAVTIAAAVVDLRSGTGSPAARVAAIVLLGVPVVFALGRVFPNARRLGAAQTSPEERSRLAREIAWAHVGCLAAMVGFLALVLRG
jgi:hypothetical protein